MEWLVRQPQHPPAVTALTLGVVGKKALPELQWRNPAFRHLSVLLAAGLISLGADWLALGQTVAFWIVAVMAAGAILARGDLTGMSTMRHLIGQAMSPFRSPAVASGRKTPRVGRDQLPVAGHDLVL